MTKILNGENNSVHYSYRSDLKNVFKYLDLTKIENIDIYKGHSPVKLNFDGERVNSVDIINNKKNIKNIIIKNSIIFCAEDLETASIIKSSSIKNENIGKFLSDHAHVNLCKIKKIK